MKNPINNLFANADYIAEAENYLFNSITDREEIREDVKNCMRDVLKEYDIYEEPDDEDIDEYTDKIMAVIEEN